MSFESFENKAIDFKPMVKKLLITSLQNHAKISQFGQERHNDAQSEVDPVSA